MANNDLEFVNQRKKETTPNDESEENDMEVYENKKECIKTIFPQWSQEDIGFCNQEIWQKERHEYEAQTTEGRRQFEDGELWQQSIVGRILEEEVVKDRLKSNSRQVKETLQQQQVNKYGAYSKNTQTVNEAISRIQKLEIEKKKMQNAKLQKNLSHCKPS